MSYYVVQPLIAGLLVVLGVGGGALALRAYRSGRVRDGLRRTGWALIPFGLLAVGVSGLAARIVGAVSRWAFQLVFSPVSWLGVGLLGVGAVLVLSARPRTAPPVEGAPDLYAEPPTQAPAAKAPRTPPAVPAPQPRSQKDAGASGLLAELEEMGLLDDEK